MLDLTSTDSDRLQTPDGYAVTSRGQLGEDDGYRWSVYKHPTDPNPYTFARTLDEVPDAIAREDTIRALAVRWAW